jgi:dipeptidyl aminopeptidase/acylaminoacyl peptidase
VLGSDMEELKDRSPVANAKGIKAKVMLMQYRSDRKVPVEQSSRMRSALRAAGNSPKWEPIDVDGGGGYFTPANRVDIYKRILRFLEERLAK